MGRRGVAAALAAMLVLAASALAPTADADQSETWWQRSPLEVAAEARAADPGCDPLQLAAPIDAPVATGTCTGVRPGAWVRSSVGRCTFNFVFEGSDGHTYIGSAGHCILKHDDELAWAPGSGPGAWDYDERLIGEWAYAIDGWGVDFALIRVFDGIEVNPSMCHWGGPTGLYTDHEGDPFTVRHYGGGVGLGDVIPARTGVALDSYGTEYLRWHGAVLWGDSGSGLIHEDGRAIGVNVLLSPGSAWGNTLSSRLDNQIPMAEAALDIELELVTAPLEVR